MLLFINAIFSYKYLSREFDNAWIVAAILVVIQLFGFLYLSKINIPKKRKAKQRNWNNQIKTNKEKGILSSLLMLFYSIKDKVSPN